VLKFPVYEMETGKISSLKNGNWKFYNLRYVNWKNFRFTKWKLEILRFPFRKPEKPTIIPFPKCKFVPEKWKP